MRYLFAVFVLSLFGSAPVALALQAQLQLGTEYFPSSKIDDVPSGSAVEKIEISYSKTYAKFGFPLSVLNQGQTILANSIYGEVLPFNFDNAISTTTSNKLGGFDYTLTWIQRWTRKWKTTAFVKPGYYSDFEESSGNSFRLQGGGIFNRVFSKNLEVGLGVIFINDFGEPSASPAFVLKYNTHKGERPPAGTHIIDINLPTQASYWRVVGEPFYLGLTANLSGGHYRITKNTPLENDTVKLSVGTVGPAVRFTPSENFVLDIQGGVTFRREFEIRSGDKEVANFDLEQSGFGRIRILVRM